jgi:hypothetical protein
MSADHNVLRFPRFPDPHGEPVDRQERADPREEDLPSKAQVSTPAPVPARTRARATMTTATRAARAVVSGAAAWESQPPSLAQLWAHHAASARFYDAGLIRGPRYVWGAVHIAIAAPAYLLVLVTDSVWKIAGLAAVVGLLFVVGVL